nr:RNase3 [Sweet potato chlorotic stunt virus]
MGDRLIPIQDEISNGFITKVFGSKDDFDLVIEYVSTCDRKDVMELFGDWFISNYVNAVLINNFRNSLDAEALNLMRAYNVSNFLLSRLMFETKLYYAFLPYMSTDQVNLCCKTADEMNNLRNANFKFLADSFERLIGWLVMYKDEQDVRKFLDIFFFPYMILTPRKSDRSLLNEWAEKYKKKLHIDDTSYHFDKTVKVVINDIEFCTASDFRSKNRAIQKAVNIAVNKLKLRG